MANTDNAITSNEKPVVDDTITDPTTGSSSFAGEQDRESSTNDDAPSDRDKTVQECVQRFRDRGIRVIIFDMDLTIVSQHSRGQLQRGAHLEEFLSNVSPDFLALVPALYKEGFQLAIATHSDEAEYGRRITRETHILGDELAKTLLQRYLEPHVADSFFVVAYNPSVRLSYYQTLFRGGWAKRHHMKEIQSHYQIENPKEMVLFDDTMPFVKDCQNNCGVHSVQVSRLTGFTLKDVLEKL